MIATQWKACKKNIKYAFDKHYDLCKEEIIEVYENGLGRKLTEEETKLLYIMIQWQEKIDEAITNGGKIIAPNNLPIMSIRYDNTCLEHEHADHPSYQFPITIEFTGPKPIDLEGWDTSYESETVALLFAAGNVILTIYECCYDIWRIDNGIHLGGSSWHQDWKISDDSLNKIRDKFKDQID